MMPRWRTAMILAAGKGTRLQPLTLTTPKPLLQVGGRALIEHHLLRLAALGVERVVINLHHLGAQIRQALGDGSRWQLELIYSDEPELLETAGGIRQALPHLGDAPFLLLNGDVFLDFDLQQLPATLEEADAHLLLIPRPTWQQRGDFNLQGPTDAGPRSLRLDADGAFTYAGVGVFQPRLFTDLAPGFRPLRSVLAAAAARDRLRGQVHAGLWEDVGTLDRLQALQAHLANRPAPSS